MAAAAVRDEGLHVRAVAGLRIADAAIKPLPPNAALRFPTMVIVERAAELLFEDYR